MTTPTITQLRELYEPVGNLIRRKDASVTKPSPVLDADDVLRIALADLAAVTAERGRLAGLLGDLTHYFENETLYGPKRRFELRDRIDAALAELNKETTK